MWTFLLILGLASMEPDPAFPDWRLGLDQKSTMPVDSSTLPPKGRSDWIVVSEHPAVRRDTLANVDVVLHPLLTALFWPIDHAVRPAMGLAVKPLRQAIRYGEETEIVDRGQAFVHPTGRENFWVYPTAVLDGTTGSRWGMTFVDKDFFCEDWRLQFGGALSVDRKSTRLNSSH